MNKIKILAFAFAITAACTSCRKKDVFPVEPVAANETGALRMNNDDPSTILPGRWIVHYFCKDKVNMTANFDHSQLIFDSAGIIHAYGELDSAVGNWNSVAGGLMINFTVGTRYSTMNGVYNMTVQTDHTIHLELVGPQRKMDALELKKLLVP